MSKHRTNSKNLKSLKSLIRIVNKMESNKNKHKNKKDSQENQESRKANLWVLRLKKRKMKSNKRKKMKSHSRMMVIIKIKKYLLKGENSQIERINKKNKEILMRRISSILLNYQNNVIIPIFESNLCYSLDLNEDFNCFNKIIK